MRMCFSINGFIINTLWNYDVCKINLHQTHRLIRCHTLMNKKSYINEVASIGPYEMILISSTFNWYKADNMFINLIQKYPSGPRLRTQFGQFQIEDVKIAYLPPPFAGFKIDFNWIDIAKPNYWWRGVLISTFSLEKFLYCMSVGKPIGVRICLKILFLNSKLVSYVDSSLRHMGKGMVS